ncbi:MAG: efflux RND transporter periplasmic adaptor subunit, partial [Clostridium sp.]|nr:efflux RND transporter periplasmic adaptor subunit [Clostridium sp.]
MKKAKMRIIWGIIIVAIAAFLIVRIFRKEEPVAPTPDPVVMVQPPAMGNIELTTNL